MAKKSAKRPALKNNRFGERYLLVFVLAFTVIGGYALLKSFAASVTISITAAPPEIVQHDASIISWKVAGTPASCTKSAWNNGLNRNDPSFSGSAAYSGSQSVQPLYNTTYLVHCFDHTGAKIAESQVKVKVDSGPVPIPSGSSSSSSSGAGGGP